MFIISNIIALFIYIILSIYLYWYAARVVAPGHVWDFVDELDEILNKYTGKNLLPKDPFPVKNDGEIEISVQEINEVMGEEMYFS